jgi:acetylornithine deacetylase/succinyl-diaminopimelate desuccinylase-like protein
VDNKLKADPLPIGAALTGACTAHDLRPQLTVSVEDFRGRRRAGREAAPVSSRDAAKKPSLHAVLITRGARKPLHKGIFSLRLLAVHAIVLVLSVRPLLAAELDWKALGEETAGVLTDLIRIDTQNPPGGETPAARVIARKLEAEGISAEVLESAPGRGNVHARLRGSGGARPIILLAHLDVVPADPSTWSVPPFAGERRDGYVYGRGALDAKGVAAIQLMTMIALKRSGQPLARDVILLATADEETGGRAGAGWITEHRPDLLGDAEYLLTEGDNIHEPQPGRYVVQVAVAEKTPCWVKLTAKGEGGHGSTPAAETAVTRLVRALEHVREYRSPIKVVPAVEDYFAAVAPLETPPLRDRLSHLAASLENPDFVSEFTHNARQNALVRNTMTPTVLQGSPKTNVIPDQASAHLDCRLLPGEDPKDFLATLRDVISDEQVQIDTLLSFPASSSDSKSALMTAIRALAQNDGAAVVPSVIPGFTDSHYFRAKGVASYGFVPFVLQQSDEKTVHGTDERVSVDNLTNGVRRLVGLLYALPPAPAK